MEHLRYTDKSLWEKITSFDLTSTISIKHEGHYHTISRNANFFRALGVSGYEHYEDFLKGMAMLLHDTEETERKRPYHIKDIVSGIYEKDLYTMLYNEMESPDYERYVRHYTEDEINVRILKRITLEKAKKEVGKAVDRKCYYITKECEIEGVVSDIEYLEPFHKALHITQPTQLLNELSDNHICEVERLYDYPTYWKGEHLIITGNMSFEEFVDRCGADYGSISERFKIFNDLEELKCTTKEKNIS